MPHSYAEYLSVEEESPVRHEYLDGEIYAMPRGTPDHAALAAAILGVIGQQLPRGCRGFTSDLRIRIHATGLSTYPDGAVVCGGSKRAADDSIAVIIPTLLIEVTSNSTEQYDRGLKLRHYQTIPTVREIVIVFHREPRLSLHRRDLESEWKSVDATAGESITLDSIGAVVYVDDVYRDGFEDAAR